MNYFLISVLFLGALVPLLAKPASFDEFTNHTNSTSPNEFMVKKVILKPEEKVLIDKLRTTYSNLLTDQYLNSDAHLIGLLEANKWSLLDASKHLKRILSWRANNKIDDLNSEEPIDDLLKRFPWRVNATTHNGCPILEVDFGRWLISDYLQSHEFTRDAINIFSRHTDQMFERSRSAIKKLAPKCQQAVLICDAKGFLMKNIAESSTLNSVIRMALVVNDKYPNLFEQFIVSNAPEDFAVLLKTLQPSIGLMARSLSIYSENETDLARKHVESYADLSTLSLITWPHEPIQKV